MPIGPRHCSSLLTLLLELLRLLDCTDYQFVHRCAAGFCRQNSNADLNDMPWADLVKAIYSSAARLSNLEIGDQEYTMDLLLDTLARLDLATLQGLLSELGSWASTDPVARGTLTWEIGAAELTRACEPGACLLYRINTTQAVLCGTLNPRPTLKYLVLDNKKVECCMLHVREIFPLFWEWRIRLGPESYSHGCAPRS